MEYKLYELVDDQCTRSDFGRVVISPPELRGPLVQRKTGSITMCCNRAFLTKESYEKHRAEKTEHGKPLDFTKFPKPPPVNPFDKLGKAIYDRNSREFWIYRKKGTVDQAFEVDSQDGIPQDANLERVTVSDVDLSKSNGGPQWIKCNLCNLNTSKRYFPNHLERCHTNGPYKCQFCTCTFLLDNARKAHQGKMHRLNLPSLISKKTTIIARAKKRLVTSKKALLLSVRQRGQRKCLECGKDFHNAHRLRDHINSHTGDRPYKCETCGITFSHSSNLKRHKKSQHGASENTGKFQCTICKSRIGSSMALARHMRIYHKKFKMKSKLLPIQPHKRSPMLRASKSLVLSDVKLPKRNSSGLFECSICHKQLTQPGAFRGHMRIHQNVKPFKCEHCGICFRLLATRQHHVKVAHTDGEFGCSFCPCRFTTSRARDRHFQIYHSSQQSGDSGKICSIEKTPEDKPELPDAKNLSGFKCDLCGAVIKQLSDYNSHKLLHSEPKRGQCNFCLKVFGSESNCKNHKKRAHADGSNKCPLCCCRYATSHPLFAHLVHDHGMKPVDWDYKKKAIKPEASQKLQLLAYEVDDKESSVKSQSPVTSRKSVSPSKSPGKGKVECDICHVKLKNFAIVASHKKKSHFNNGQFRCSNCPCRFVTSQGLIVHLSLYHGHVSLTKKNKMKWVNGKLPDNNEEAKMVGCGNKMATTHKIRIHECELCHVKLLHRSSLRNHKRTSHLHNGKFQCSKCCCKFLTSNGLVNHNKYFHGLKAKRQKIRVKGASHLRLTKDMPTVSSTSTISSESPNKTEPSTNVNPAPRVASGEKKYECELCHFKFITASSVQLHKSRSHVPNGDFKCSDCSCVFAASSGLLVHQTLYHGFVGQNRQRRLQQESMATTQPDVGDSEKSMGSIGANGISPKTQNCGLCHLEIRGKKTKLSQHVQNSHLHNGEFECSECTCKYLTLKGLRRHQYLHHTVKGHSSKSKLKQILPSNKAVSLKSSSLALLRLFKSSKTSSPNLSSTDMQAQAVAKNFNREYKKPTAECDLCGCILLRGCLVKHKAVAHSNGKYKCDQCICCFHTVFGLHKHRGWHKTKSAPPNLTPMHSENGDNERTEPNSGLMSAQNLNVNQEGKPAKLNLNFLKIRGSLSSNPQKPAELSKKLFTNSGKLGGKYKHKCSMCECQFLQRYNLQKHKKFAHAKGGFPCSQCSCTFRNNLGLAAHKRVYHSENISNGFIHKSRSLKMEEAEDSIPLGFENGNETDGTTDAVSTISKLSDSSGTTTRSGSGSTGRPKSSRIVMPKLELQSHVPVQDFPFKCDLCSKSFPTQKAVEKHTLSHTRPEQCRKCDMKFRTKEEVVKHMKLLHGSGAFPCSMCSCRFTSEKGARSHLALFHKRNNGLTRPNMTTPRSNSSSAFHSDNFVIEHERDDMDGNEPFLRLDSAYTRRRPDLYSYAASRANHDADESEPIVQGILETNYSSGVHYTNELESVPFVQGYHQFQANGFYGHDENLESYPIQEQENDAESEAATQRITAVSSFSEVATPSDAPLKKNRPNPKSRPMKCSACAVICRGPDSLREHMIKTHNNQSQPTPGLTKRHEDSQLLNCDKCTYQFQTSAELAQHLQMEHDASGLYRCAYCPCTMKTEPNLRFHFMKYHGS